MTIESSNGAAGSGGENGSNIVVGEEGRVLASGVDSLYITSDVF